MIRPSQEAHLSRGSSPPWPRGKPSAENVPTMQNAKKPSKTSYPYLQPITDQPLNRGSFLSGRSRLVKSQPQCGHEKPVNCGENAFSRREKHRPKTSGPRCGFFATARPSGRCRVNSETIENLVGPIA